MKRLLAIFVAAMLLLSLAACGTTSQPAPSEAETEPAAETTAETTPEEAPAEEAAPADNEEFFIGFSALMTGSEQVMLIVNAITDYLEANGCTVQLSDAGGDLPTQISQIENFATMGADLVIILSIDMDTLYDACIKAEDQGTKTFFFGMQPSYVEEIGGCNAVGYYNIGVAAAELMLKWVDEKYPDAEPGSLPIAVSAMDSYADGKEINVGFADRLAEDGRCVIDYYENVTENTSEDGFNFMQNALTYNPDLKLFFNYNNGMSLGVDEYLTSNNYDLSEICVIGTGEVSYAAEQVEKSKTDESALRGYIGYGAADMASYIGDIVIGLCNGSRAPGQVIWDPIYAVSMFDYEVPAELAGG